MAGSSYSDAFDKLAGSRGKKPLPPPARPPSVLPTDIGQLEQPVSAPGIGAAGAFEDPARFPFGPNQEQPQSSLADALRGVQEKFKVGVDMVSPPPAAGGNPNGGNPLGSGVGGSMRRADEGSVFGGIDDYAGIFNRPEPQTLGYGPAGPMPKRARTKV
jgi:hypothetical protein